MMKKSRVLWQNNTEFEQILPLEQFLVELKIDKFRHEYASQLNMYLNYFKAEVMQPDDNPPIGILLCTEKGDTLVKYATAGLDPNIFVQKYMIELPSEEEIKAFIASSNY